MALDRTTLYTYLRRAPFGGRLTQQQVEGVDAILDAWSLASTPNQNNQLAYVLATAFHETGGRMAPVREGFAKTDAGARKILANRPYAKATATGKAYYGRGLVQLTWEENYAKMEKLLTLPLVKDPDIALDLDVSANILVVGMLRGVFTGKKLSDYFSTSVNDPIGARRIINGTDKKGLIATYYEQFLSALEAADTKTPLPVDVTETEAAPDAPPLSTDKTVIGAATSILGAGGAGLLGAINSPWGFAALVFVGIGVILFLTGRLEIRRKAGA